MAKVHVMTSPRAGVYNAVVHALVPAGANEVGVTWQTIALSMKGEGATLAAGTAAEQTQFDAGTLVEIPMEVQLEPSSMSGPTLVAALNTLADRAVARWLAETGRAYRYWGYAQGTVS